jgi:hypothetical protein
MLKAAPQRASREELGSHCPSYFSISGIPSRSDASIIFGPLLGFTLSPGGAHVSCKSDCTLACGQGGNGILMTYRFERGRLYRMPTHFGPAPGPRQMPVEAHSDPTQSPPKILVAASFLTDAAALERHLLERFSLFGEPVVTVEFHHMTHIDWLAGRGYTMVHVWWPATFAGTQDQASGRFLAVMWEIRLLSYSVQAGERTACGFSSASRPRP